MVSPASGCALRDRAWSGPWYLHDPTLWDVSSHGVKRYVPRHETSSPTAWDHEPIRICADRFLGADSCSTVFFFVLPERDRVYHSDALFRKDRAVMPWICLWNSPGLFLAFGGWAYAIRILFHRCSGCLSPRHDVSC